MKNEELQAAYGRLFSVPCSLITVHRSLQKARIFFSPAASNHKCLDSSFRWNDKNDREEKEIHGYPGAGADLRGLVCAAALGAA